MTRRSTSKFSGHATVTKKQTIHDAQPQVSRSRADEHVRPWLHLRGGRAPSQRHKLPPPDRPGRPPATTRHRLAPSVRHGQKDEPWLTIRAGLRALSLRHPGGPDAPGSLAPKLLLSETVAARAAASTTTRWTWLSAACRQVAPPRATFCAHSAAALREQSRGRLKMPTRKSRSQK